MEQYIEELKRWILFSQQLEGEDDTEPPEEGEGEVAELF